MRMDHELCRENVAQCLKWARAARDEAMREGFMAMAAVWTSAAMRLPPGTNAKDYGAVAHKRAISNNAPNTAQIMRSG